MEQSCQKFVVSVATSQPFKMNRSESSQKSVRKSKGTIFVHFMILLLLNECVYGINQVKKKQKKINLVINKDYSLRWST